MCGCIDVCTDTYVRVECASQHMNAHVSKAREATRLNGNTTRCNQSPFMNVPSLAASFVLLCCVPLAGLAAAALAPPTWSVPLSEAAFSHFGCRFLSMVLAKNCTHMYVDAPFAPLPVFLGGGRQRMLHRRSLDSPWNRSTWNEMKPFPGKAISFTFLENDTTISPFVAVSTVRTVLPQQPMLPRVHCFAVATHNT